jgi:hypothetical protein
MTMLAFMGGETFYEGSMFRRTDALLNDGSHRPFWIPQSGRVEPQTGEVARAQEAVVGGDFAVTAPLKLPPDHLFFQQNGQILANSGAAV